MDIYLAVVGAYDLQEGAATTLYFATGRGWVSEPGDTPGDTHFDPRLLVPGRVRRRMFRGGDTKGRAQLSSGSLELNNEDGTMDTLFTRYSVDGRTVDVYKGQDGSAFPGSWTKVWTGQALQPEANSRRVRIPLRDVLEELDDLLQSTHYAGTNTPPDGVEGGADLEGRPKPLAYGKVRNISPPMVNTSRLIFQVSEDAVDSVDMVMDRGVELIPPGKFTNRTHAGGDLMADACWSRDDGQFVAVPIDTGYVGTEALTSPDGVTWTVRTIQSGWWFVVRYGNGVYVAGGGSGVSTPTISTSPDGVTWTARTSNISGTTVRALATDGEGNWVAIGATGDASYSTDDGATWTAATTNPASGAEGAVFAFGSFFMVSNLGTVYESTDGGDNWTDVGVTGDALRGIVFGFGRLVAVGDNGRVLTSADGAIFEDRDGTPALPGQVGTVGVGPGYFMVGGSASDLAFARSEDGILWEAFEAPWASGTCWAIVWAQAALKWLALRSTGGSDNLWTSSGPGTDYGSQAALLDDAQAPEPGEFRAYPAGGLVRLGSRPRGVVTADVTVEATAAERTAAQQWVALLQQMGKSNPSNLQTEDDLDAWTKAGSPTITDNILDPWGGTDAQTVADTGAGQQDITETVTYTTDGQKLAAFVVRERSEATGGSYHQLRAEDQSAPATRLELRITGWVDGEPTITETTGTVARKRYIGNGYWLVVGLTTAVTAANTNVLNIVPVQSAAETGSIDVYKVRTWDSDDLADFDWSWLDVLEVDSHNSAECGQWVGPEYVRGSEALDRIAQSIGAWWGPDREGLLRLQILRDPQVAVNGWTFGRELDNAAWSKTRASVTADQAIGPNGVQEADELVEDSTASATHLLSREFPWPVAAGRTAVCELWAKQNTRTEIRVAIQDRDGSTALSGFVDLTDGTVGTTSGADLEVVEAFGGYWIRITATLGSGANEPQLHVHLSSGSETISYNGDGSSSVYLWDVTFPDKVDLDLKENDLVQHLRVNQSLQPTYRHHVRYRRNYTQQQVGGLALGVSDERREVVAQEYAETESTDAAVQTRHALAREQVVETLLDERDDASTEADRLQELRGVMRQRFVCGVELDTDCDCKDIGRTVRLTHSRWGLAFGKVFTVMGAEDDPVRDVVNLELWG